MKAFSFRERETGEIWKMEATNLNDAWAKLGEEYIYALELQRSMRKRDREGDAKENFDLVQNPGRATVKTPLFHKPGLKRNE
jgi:hypothetical protein